MIERIEFAMRGRSIAFGCCALWACASTNAQRPAPVGADSTDFVPPQTAAVAGRDESSGPPVPEDVVERAAQPFHAERTADGRELSQSELFAELSRFDVLCLGEAHDQARDHYAELMITQAVAERARFSGRSLGVGFEMFQEPFADALVAYGNGRVSDAELRKRTQYDARWGFPYAYYQPILAFGRARGLPLRALNAPRELSHAVAEKGLAGLSPKEQRELPELDLNDAEHRVAFDRLMEKHPLGPGMNLDNFYAAQVVWDETMADNAANWVTAREPSRQLVVIAGLAHCQKEAIPARILQRAPLQVASVRLGPSHSEDKDAFAYSLVFDGE